MVRSIKDLDIAEDVRRIYGGTGSFLGGVRKRRKAQMKRRKKK